MRPASESHRRERGACELCPRVKKLTGGYAPAIKPGRARLAVIACLGNGRQMDYGLLLARRHGWGIPPWRDRVLASHCTCQPGDPRTPEMSRHWSVPLRRAKGCRGRITRPARKPLLRVLWPPQRSSRTRPRASMGRDREIDAIHCPRSPTVYRTRFSLLEGQSVVQRHAFLRRRHSACARRRTQAQYDHIIDLRNGRCDRILLGNASSACRQKKLRRSTGIRAGASLHGAVLPQGRPGAVEARRRRR